MNPKFTFDDLCDANEAWGCNCGPGALAAILDLTLDQVRPLIPSFEEKRYTNPTLMRSALKSAGAKFEKVWSGWPGHGLVRIQWEGPWTKPGVPVRAALRYTHWVGCKKRVGGSIGDIGIFDVNAMSNGTGWCSLADWDRVVVPFILEQYPRASGKWHITDAIEVAPLSARAAA